jgi:sarcosine oxidase subunit alpha
VTGRRLPAGGSRIDRSRPVSLRFDGRGLEAFEGDTLASALIASGVVGGFVSPILGRPRGIVSAGSEEPNAFVAVLEPWTDVIVPATLVPAVDGLVAESRPGVGRLVDSPDRREPRRRHRHVETLVIGGGIAGRAAAAEAAQRGDRVLLVDEGRVIDEPPSSHDLTALPNATALGVYDAGYAVVHERTPDLERVWHVRARNVVLATGALERPIAFAGNDLPGVMLAGSVAAYLERFGVAPAERVVVFSTNDWGTGLANVLTSSGIEVVRTIDARAGERVVAARGDDALEAVLVRDAAGSEESLEADLLAVSGGWNPNLTLWRAIGGDLTYEASRSCFVPGAGPPWLSVAGAAAGEVPDSEPLWFVEEGEDAEKFVDLQRDQTVADVAAALGRGLRSVEHVKRATYIGTAVDQGRTSGVLAAEIVNHLLGEGPGAQGPSGARPPYAPVSFAALAGPFAGDRFDPARTTPMHAWHAEHGAVFEDTGQWKRPRYFAPDGEPIDAAVERECLAVRNAVGAMDASTLGKIEVVGPDAPAFLDRMYTNKMSNLAIGAIRYGVMLGLDGMVWDDGVAMRVAEDRYYVTTTSGGAANVLDRFEEWLQTEWPELRVYCTSVTEQWAVVAVNGPKAREVLAAVGTDVDLSREAFPFMTFRDGRLGGVPARLARVSFSGELAYELHVSSWHGLDVWEAVLGAGEPFGIRPYGLEAMDVLRAEKGFFIIGQETDGTVTPSDLGMDWIVNPSKGDFLGRRSLRRTDLVRPDRKQLVGLLPEDPAALIPEGAQLVLEDTGRIPMPMSGHVTSSYRSPSLDRTFALGLVAGGHGMHGRTVYAPLPEGTIAAKVTAPVFYDPQGERRDG